MKEPNELRENHSCGKCIYFFLNEEEKKVARYNALLGDNSFISEYVDKESCGFSPLSVVLKPNQTGCSNYKEHTK